VEVRGREAPKPASDAPERCGFHGPAFWVERVLPPRRGRREGPWPRIPRGRAPGPRAGSPFGASGRARPGPRFLGRRPPCRRLQEADRQVVEDPSESEGPEPGVTPGVHGVQTRFHEDMGVGIAVSVHEPRALPMHELPDRPADVRMDPSVGEHVGRPSRSKATLQRGAGGRDESPRQVPGPHTVGEVGQRSESPGEVAEVRTEGSLAECVDDGGIVRRERGFPRLSSPVLQDLLREKQM